MLEPQIEVKFTVALTEIPKEHRVAAQRKAHEAFVIELLRQGDISAGCTAELLGVNRSQLVKLMYEYNISPFDDTMSVEDLQQEVAEYLKDLRKSSSLSGLIGAINSQVEPSPSYEKTAFSEAVASKLAKQGIRRP